MATRPCNYSWRTAPGLGGLHGCKHEHDHADDHACGTCPATAPATRALVYHARITEREAIVDLAVALDRQMRTAPMPDTDAEAALEEAARGKAHVILGELIGKIRDRHVDFGEVVEQCDIVLPSICSDAQLEAVLKLFPGYRVGVRGPVTIDPARIGIKVTKIEEETIKP